MFCIDRNKSAVPLIFRISSGDLFRSTLQRSKINNLRYADYKQQIWLRITNIFPNYNQRDTTFLDLFISTDALHVSGDSSAHHQKHITVHTASCIVKQYCCLLLAWMWWYHLIHASSSTGWQYLKLYVQFYAPDDGQRNRLKLVECL